LAFAVTALFVAAGVGACDDSDPTLQKNPTGGGGGGGGGAADAGPGGTLEQKQAYAEKLYREIEPQLKEACGKQCHELGVFVPEPPKFLAGPDSYVSIRKHPGIVVKDAFQSGLVTKGAHAGPAIGYTAGLEAKAMTWLEAEALALSAAKLPGTDPFTVKSGPNEVDISKASQGLTGVKLKFDASVIGGVLSLKNLKLVAPAGTDVHVNAPRFVRIKPVVDPKAPEIADSSFSNVDQTLQGGTEAELGPGSVFLSGEGWTPFDINADKLRFDANKLEKGTYQPPPAIKKCKDINAFATTILPALRGQGVGAGSTCNNCHGAGLAGLSLNGNDNQAICDSVLSKLNETNIPQSILVLKAAAQGTQHNGGKVTNGQGFTDLFNNNRAIFF
jgi:hypothetical protein